MNKKEKEDLNEEFRNLGHLNTEEKIIMTLACIIGFLYFIAIVLLFTL